MARKPVGFNADMEGAITSVADNLNKMFPSGIGGGKQNPLNLSTNQKRGSSSFLSQMPGTSQSRNNPMNFSTNQKRNSNLFSGGGFGQFAGKLSGKNLNNMFGSYSSTDPMGRQYLAEQAKQSFAASSGGNGAAADQGKIQGTLQHKALLEQVAQESGVPWQVLAATMALESGGQNLGANNAGAVGLMQVVPQYWQETANKYGGNLADPYTNVRTAAEIMKQNYDTYGSWEKAAAAYFGGGGAFNADGSYSFNKDEYGTDISAYVNAWANNLSAFGYGTQTGGDVAGGGSAATAQAEFAARKASSAIGTPYIWGGESYEEGGFDCSGLIQWAYEGKVQARTAHEQYGETQRIGAADLQKGDLMFFDWQGDGVIDHVGMYWGNGQMLHAPKENDIVKITNVNDDFWNNATVGYGRVM